MLLSLTWFDYVLLAIVIVSILWGLWRGFIKEVMSLLTWIIAVVVAVSFVMPLATYLNQYVGGASAATAISFILLFVVVLIVGALVSYIIDYFMSGFLATVASNHLLGGVFGLVRGLLLVILLWFVVISSGKTQASWFQQSQIVSRVPSIVAWLQDQASAFNLGEVSQKTRDQAPSIY